MINRYSGWPGSFVLSIGICLGILASLLLTGCTMSRKATPPAASQFPSPMVENIREHIRISEKTLPGTTIELTGILPKPVEVYIPEKQGNRRFTKLLIHFHGSSFIPEYAVYTTEHAVVCAAVTLGANDPHQCWQNINKG